MFSDGLEANSPLLSVGWSRGTSSRAVKDQDRSAEARSEADLYVGESTPTFGVQTVAFEFSE